MQPLPTSNNAAPFAVPEGTLPAGYAALITAFGLTLPSPDTLSAISEKHTMRDEGAWRIYTPRYEPDRTIVGHLEFAIRHEGIDLAVLNALFKAAGPDFVIEWVKSQPKSNYARRVWFLYEWLLETKIDLADADPAPYAGVLDDKVQFAVTGETVTRHRIRNNLPGTPGFCPLVRRSKILTDALSQDLAKEARAIIQRTAPDLVTRAAAFLLISDSKASYDIEGEKPSQDRIRGWAQAINQAGQTPLSGDELLRLQRLVMGKVRFTKLGWRTEGGFVGPRDRETNAPLPEHISARHDDIASLIRGLLAYNDRSLEQHLDPIVAAAAVAFGFVFIHPFEDGNGRVHRWLIHDVLARAGFNPPGVIFPISAVFLEHIDTYRRVLEHYSQPRLPLISWDVTPKFNVEVLNQTRDLYRFFDVTKQAEFLANSVSETVHQTLPHEIEYIRRYDLARRQIESIVEMPDATFNLMMGFLRQNGGHFSARARKNEFDKLTEDEATSIERIYGELLVELDKASPANRAHL